MSTQIKKLVRSRKTWLTLGLLGLAVLVVSLLPSAAVLAQGQDSDGDGLPDDLEAAIGTDPNLPDTDGDSWLDGPEVFLHGTSPLLDDTDFDGEIDSTDGNPLDNGSSADGGTEPDYVHDANVTHENFAGTIPFDGVGKTINLQSGEFRYGLSCDFGPSIMGRASIDLVYRSGVTCDTAWGSNWFSSVDHWIRLQHDCDIEVYWFGRKGVFDEVSGNYTAPDGWPFRLTHDPQNGEYHLTAIRGGMKWKFDETSGRCKGRQDRFGNAETYTRDGNGVLTEIGTADGLRITVTSYPGTQRVQTLSGVERTYSFVFNCNGDLAQFSNAAGETTQFLASTGSSTPSLNHNVVRILDPMGEDILRNEFDSADRTTTQYHGSSANNFRLAYYPATSETILFDLMGAKRRWKFGSPPTELEIYSNLNVRSTDPASWLYTFEHNANGQRTKTVFPRGNSVAYTWDANYCLTRERMKQDDDDPNNDDEDLVWNYTYGSTYYMLKNVTDPRGNTTQRTLNSLEQVTLITHPTITHVDPDVTITESYTYDTSGQMLTHTDGEGALTKYEYYTSGRKLNLPYRTIRDYGTAKLNLTTSYDYSSFRLLTSKTDPDGNTWAYEYDAMGRRTKSTSPSPQCYETVVVYNPRGQVAQQDVENVDRYNLRISTNPWWTTTFVYNNLAQRTSVTEEITSSTTRTTSFTYDAAGRASVVTKPEGNKDKTVYDERGMVYQAIRGYLSTEGSTEEYAYDGNGNQTARKDGRGKTWTTTFDLFDRVTKITTPLGHYTSFVLNENGNLTETKSYSSSNALLAHQKQHYDEMNRLWKLERWLDREAPTPDDWMATVYQHDDEGRVTQITDPENHSTYFTFDAAGRRTQRQDHLGNKVTYGYASDCCSATEIEEVEKKPGTGTETFRTELVLDPLNRVTQRRIVDRDNSTNKHTWSMVYSSLGVVEVQNAEGGKVCFSLDGLGRSTAQEVHLGSGRKMVTTLTFDKNGRQIQVTDDLGNDTFFGYDSRDLLVGITYDDSSERSMSYDAAGNGTGWEDANGSDVTVTYDSDGRMTARSITRGTDVVGTTLESFSYDGLGRLTEAKDNDSTVRRSYDTLSRLLSEVQGPNPIGTSGRTITYTYNGDGSRDTCTYFSGYELTYTMDAVGRVKKIEDSSSTDLVEWTYFGPGRRIKTVEYNNGASENYEYDGFRNISDLYHKNASSQEFGGFAYSYDKCRNRVWVEHSHDSDAGDVFAYDKAGRLVGALLGSLDPSAESDDDDWEDYEFGVRIDYQLDDVSNRSSVNRKPYGQQQVSETYYRNGLNQYWRIDSAVREHDSNGNLTSDGSREYCYDFFDRLVEVKVNGVVVVEFEYDALGRRIGRQAGSSITGFLYDGPHVVEEVDAQGNLERRFVYGQKLDEIRLMMGRDCADVDDDLDTNELVALYFHGCASGSVRFMTDAASTVAESYEYTPYGLVTIRNRSGSEVSWAEGVGNPFLFACRRWDPLAEAYHYRNRSYSPSAGRFLQRDPLTVRSTGGDYEYARSSPVKYRDGLGLFSVASGVAEELIASEGENGVGLFQEAPSGPERPSKAKPYCKAVSVDIRTDGLGRVLRKPPPPNEDYRWNPDTRVHGLGGVGLYRRKGFGPPKKIGVAWEVDVKWFGKYEYCAVSQGMAGWCACRRIVNTHSDGS
jgi:RHS repeat-associated protein